MEPGPLRGDRDVAARARPGHRAGSREVVPEDSPTILLLHAVFGFDAGPRFAVGGNLAGVPPHVGVIVQHPGP